MTDQVKKDMTDFGIFTDLDVVHIDQKEKVRNRAKESAIYTASIPTL